MTTAEKINQLEKEIQLLEKLVKSNDDTIYAQRQVISELYRQIEMFESFRSNQRGMY